MDITELLAFSAKQNASDLHLSAGLPPMIRVDGDIRRLNVPAMENSDVRRLIYDIMNDRQRRDYEEHLEADFSFEVPGVARFRVNAFSCPVLVKFGNRVFVAYNVRFSCPINSCFFLFFTANFFYIG